MSIAKRIAKNSSSSVVAKLSTPLSSFVLVFLIARSSGAAMLGEYSAALSLLFIFQAVVSLGFPYLITKEVAQDNSKAEQYFTNASAVGGFFSLLAAGAMCFSIHLVTNNASTIRAAYILSISLVPYSLATVYQSISRGFEKLDHIAIAMIAGNAVKMIVGMIIIFKGYGLTSLMLVITVTHFIILFASGYFALKLIPRNDKLFKLDVAFCRRVVKTSPVFSLILIIGTFRMNIDSLLLNAIMGEREVGLYSAASRLVTMFSVGIGFYILGAQPVLFGLFNSSKEKLQSVCRESTRFFFIILFPVIAVSTVLNDKIILLIFKEEFLPSAQVLSISIWVIIFTAVNQIQANILIASHNEKINLYGNVISLVSNIVLNVLLVPKMGIIGAGIANTASAFVNLVFQHYFVSRQLFILPYFRIAVKPLAASAVMALLLTMVREVNLFFVIIISFSVYFLILVLFKELTAKDVDSLRNIFSRENQPKTLRERI